MDVLIEKEVVRRELSEIANERLLSYRQKCDYHLFWNHANFQPIRVTEGRDVRVPSQIYNDYRKVLAGACADIVITTVLPDGLPAVLAIMRGPDACFAGKWWMQGGSVLNCVPMGEFVKKRAEEECGVKPFVEGVIGVFRTVDEGKPVDTIQTCYVGFAPYQKVNDKFKPDGDHEKCRLLTYSDVQTLTPAEAHWYPCICFLRALRTMRHRTPLIGDEDQ